MANLSTLNGVDTFPTSITNQRETKNDHVILFYIKQWLFTILKQSNDDWYLHNTLCYCVNSGCRLLHRLMSLTSSLCLVIQLHYTLNILIMAHNIIILPPVIEWEHWCDHSITYWKVDRLEKRKINSYVNYNNDSTVWNCRSTASNLYNLIKINTIDIFTYRLHVLHKW